MQRIIQIMLIFENSKNYEFREQNTFKYLMLLKYQISQKKDQPKFFFVSLLFFLFLLLLTLVHFMNAHLFLRYKLFKRKAK